MQSKWFQGLLPRIFFFEKDVYNTFHEHLKEDYISLTPPKTNMSPKQGLFQHEIHLPTIDFRGTVIRFPVFVDYKTKGQPSAVSSTVNKKW